MRLSLLPVFLLLLPLAEIAGFVIVGQAIGLWATLGLIVLTSIVGALLLRIQGLGMINRISKDSRAGINPGRELVHGAMIVVAGFLLLLPGFITDVIGLLLFIPFVRDLAWARLGTRVVVRTANPFSQRGGRDPQPGTSGPANVVDLDDDEFSRDPNPRSPWSGTKQIED
jgi:UPF0716 protein FxsA